MQKISLYIELLIKYIYIYIRITSIKIEPRVFCSLTCITCILFFIYQLPARAIEPPTEKLVSVELFSISAINHIRVISPTYIQKLNLELDKTWQIKAKHKSLLAFNDDSNTKKLLPKSITLLPVENKPICLETENIKGRCYRGTIEIQAQHQTLLIINKLPLIDYLRSTVGSELPPDWPAEAVKAQTVTIHTYLLFILNNLKTLKDSTQNQFYGGTGYENLIYNTYINEVKDVIILGKNKQPIEALYHSTCAGHTLNNESVFGGKAVNYLRATPCKHDNESNFARTKTFHIKFNQLKKLMNVEEMNFIRQENNQLKAIKLDNKVLNSYDFWLKLGQTLGWGAVPGVKYNIKCINNDCEITSAGAGHAVGLCQWGARGLAKKGYYYNDILMYYYKNIFFYDSLSSTKI